jgi:hypothetical protein
MKYKETAEKLAEYRSQIAEIREKMRSAQASIEPEEVQDYEFATPQGKARLSALFGDKDTLFVIHNMGITCPYCTMWADGFNGVFEHLRDRAAFAEFRRQSWLEVSHGLEPRNDVCGRYGLSPEWPRYAGRFGLQAQGRQDHAGGGYRLQTW